MSRTRKPSSYPDSSWPIRGADRAQGAPRVQRRPRRPPPIGGASDLTLLPRYPASSTQVQAGSSVQILAPSPTDPQTRRVHDAATLLGNSVGCPQCGVPEDVFPLRRRAGQERGLHPRDDLVCSGEAMARRLEGDPISIRAWEARNRLLDQPFGNEAVAIARPCRQRLV